jgi:hypothetical protein
LHLEISLKNELDKLEGGLYNVIGFRDNTKSKEENIDALLRVLVKLF